MNTTKSKTNTFGTLRVLAGLLKILQILIHVFLRNISILGISGSSLIFHSDSLGLL